MFSLGSYTWFEIADTEKNPAELLNATTLYKTNQNSLKKCLPQT